MFRHTKPAPNLHKMHEAFLSKTMVLITKPELLDQLTEVEKNYRKEKEVINTDSNKISLELMNDKFEIEKDAEGNQLQWKEFVERSDTLLDR